MSPPVWKKNPPCKAHQMLSSMFEKGKITQDATPASVWKSELEFQKFTLPVFRNNFTHLRNAHGLGLRQTVEDDCGGASASGYSKRARLSDFEDSVSIEMAEDSTITTKNMPVLTSVYKDPSSQKEFVSLIVSLPGGAEDVEFSLVGSGPGSNLARITFSWPPVMYDIDDVLEIEALSTISDKDMARAAALKEDLQNNRHAIDVKPRGTIDVLLPIPVQTSISSYTHRGKKKTDGSLVVIADLMAYQTTYTVPQSARKVEFK